MTRDAEHTQTGYEDAASVVVNQATAPSSLAGGEDTRFYAVKAAVEHAMMDERGGKPCGCIIEAGCEARGYDDPGYAASGFIWQATNAILAALSPEAPARVGVALSDALDLWIVDGLKKADRRIMEIKPSGCDGMSSEDVESGRVSAYQLGFQNGVRSTLTDASFVIMNAAAEPSDGTREAIKEACDLLAERTYGNPARSPGHNARLVLEAALTPRHEAPAEPCKSCNGTGRELGSAFNRCSDCEAPAEAFNPAEGSPATRLQMGMIIAARDEAPSEGVGEVLDAAEQGRLAAVINMLEPVAENNETVRLYGKEVAVLLKALRARSSAPEAREAIAVFCEKRAEQCEMSDDVSQQVHGRGLREAAIVARTLNAPEAREVEAGCPNGHQPGCECDVAEEDVARSKPAAAAPSADKLRIDLWWNAEDWETTFDNIEDAYEAATNAEMRGVAALGRATQHDTVFAARIDIDTTGDGDADDYEIRLFATREEALAATPDALKGDAK